MDIVKNFRSGGINIVRNISYVGTVCSMMITETKIAGNILICCRASVAEDKIWGLQVRENFIKVNSESSNMSQSCSSSLQATTCVEYNFWNISVMKGFLIDNLMQIQDYYTWSLLSSIFCCTKIWYWCCAVVVSKFKFSNL